VGQEKKYKFSDFFKFHEKQKQAFQYIGKGKRIFFGGARGGGKSAFSLGVAVLCSIQFPGLSTVIIRRRYFDLQHTFIYRLGETYPESVFKYRYIKKIKVAEFENGSKIVFKAVGQDTDLEDIQGGEFQLIIIDEANNFDQDVIHRLVGSLRKSKGKIGLRGFTPTLLMTGNPGGRSDIYFKTRFVEPNYSYWKDYELNHKDEYIFVPSGPHDNPYLDDNYIQWLESMPEGLQQAWLYGNWNVFQGQFFEEWNPSVHVVESFEIPPHWERFSGMDLGFTEKHPTVFLWAAIDPDTHVIHVYRECIITGDLETQAITIASMQEGEEIGMQMADPSMFSDTRKYSIGDDSPAVIFMKSGIVLLPADNGRINGWRMVKQWLHWDENHGPKLVFHDSCYRTVEVMPTLRYAGEGDSEDLDTRQPYDDFADALRYMLSKTVFYETLAEKEEREYIERKKEEEQEEQEAYSIKVKRDPVVKNELLRREWTSRDKWKESVYVSDISMFT